MYDKGLYEYEDELKLECPECDNPRSTIVVSGMQLEIDSKYMPGLRTIDIDN